MNKYFYEEIAIRAFTGFPIIAFFIIYCTNIVVTLFVATFVLHRVVSSPFSSLNTYILRKSCDENYPNATASEKLSIYEEQLCINNNLYNSIIPTSQILVSFIIIIVIFIHGTYFKEIMMLLHIGFTIISTIIGAILNIKFSKTIK